MAPDPPFKLKLHQATKKASDHAVVGPVHYNVDIAAVFMYAKKNNATDVNLVEVTQSGPGNTRIGEISVNLQNFKGLCPVGQLFDPESLECVDKKICIGLRVPSNG